MYGFTWFEYGTQAPEAKLNAITPYNLTETIIWTRHGLFYWRMYASLGSALNSD